MLTDEAKALRNSPQGQELLTEMVTDGRKNNAALWVASQQASDMDGTLAELLGNRFAFRQDSRAAAVKAAEFVGLQQPSGDQLEELQHLEPGQALYRDLRGRVALIQIIEALDDQLHMALDTHPGGDERSKLIRQHAGDSVPLEGPGLGEVALGWDDDEREAG
jgi:hypothetical protein